MKNSGVVTLAHSIASFEVLVRKVKEAFFDGRQRVRQEMARTYWQTGKYIHEHILHHKERADYGEKVIARLAGRTKVGKSTLERMLRVYREFPKIASSVTQLNLTHFYALASIPDETVRREFAERAVEEKWDTRKLASKIRTELRYDSKTSDGENSAKGAGPDSELLKPKLGILYTYRMVESKPAQANPSRLEIDQGFSVHRAAFKMRGKIRAGNIIESRKEKDGTYAAVKSTRGEEALYTYRAWVERVVDGDTQFVEIDLGFDGDTEQYLRLRGIDCPEIETPEGKKAKVFVESRIKPAPFILLTSSRSDKFDRYLADVFVPLAAHSKIRPSAPEALVKYDGEEYLYLNNELLLRGLAVRLRY